MRLMHLAILENKKVFKNQKHEAMSKTLKSPSERAPRGQTGNNFSNKITWN